MSTLVALAIFAVIFLGIFAVAGKLGERTTRFGGLPAIRLGRFWLVWGFSRWKFGTFCQTEPEGIDRRTYCGLNIGKVMVFRQSEQAASPFDYFGCKGAA